MAVTETFVDPDIAADSGAGTVGDPYGDVQFSLNTITRDATNGDRINIKAGTDEILAAALSLATYGTPTNTASLTFQGYTSAADDGGIGGISGNNSVSVFSSTTLDWIKFVDLHCHNTGSAIIIQLDNNIVVINCELNNTTNHALDIDNECVVVGNYIHDVGTRGIYVNFGLIQDNYLANGTKTFTEAIRSFGFSSAIVQRNIITLNGSSVGIVFTSSTEIRNNSILSSSGTGQGIIHQASNQEGITIVGNLIEGFSGTGGIGIDTLASTDLNMYGQNAAFNNTTNYSVDGQTIKALGDNEALGSTPFAKSGSNTFANRFIYFSPLDVGNVRAGVGYPDVTRLDKGAIQHADAGGGTTSILGSGNLRGGFA